MSRFTAKTVFFGFVSAWRLAIWPTSRSPLAVKPTMEGVVRAPSWLGMTWAAPPSMTATQEFVVPRSMPITLPTLDLEDAQYSLAVLSVCCLFRRTVFVGSLGDLDEGRPEQPVLEEICFSKCLDDRALGHARSR